MKKRARKFFPLLIYSILFFIIVTSLIIAINLQPDKSKILKKTTENEAIYGGQNGFNEGKINFQPIAITEQQFTFSPPRIGAHTVAESSGVVASRVYPGIYWMIGDSGQPARIHAVNETGSLKRSFDVSGSSNIDWEDIALDENNNIWIADTGDNAQTRNDYILYRVAEPNPFGTGVSVTPTIFRFIYPDGKKDSEAVFIWQNVPYVVQKRPQNARVYRFPELDSSKTVTLTFVGEFNNANNWITGADISRDGKRLALSNDGADYHWVIERSESSASISDFFNSPISQWRMQFSNEQSEAIAFVNGTYDLIVTSEYDTPAGTNGIIWKINKEMYDLTPYNFTFSAGGDHGWNANTNASLRKLRDLQSNFYLALGDMSYGPANTESDWCNMVKSYLGSTFPFELVSGNHEDDSRVNGYIGNFASCLPDLLNSNGVYSAQYYFDYQNLARVIMISPNLNIDGKAYSYNQGTSQYNWLSDSIDQARSAGIPWIVVGMHKNCITPATKSCEVGVDLMNLLITKKVDLILQGHDHIYARSKQLSCLSLNSYNPSCITDDGSDSSYSKGKGPVIVIDGTFGRSLYSINTADTEIGYFSKWMGENVNPSYGFVQFSVNEKQLSSRFILSSGTYTDSFTIKQSCDNADFDQDGYNSNFCGGNDCNDYNNAINPSAQEICSDNVDNNCNLQIDTSDAFCSQPKEIEAFNRDGQTFLTWKEFSDFFIENLTFEEYISILNTYPQIKYGIYRHTSPINSLNLAQAEKIAEVGIGTGYNRYLYGANSYSSSRDIPRFVIQEGIGGWNSGELPLNTGLYVHTTTEPNGEFYYAVTFINNTIENVNDFSSSNSLQSRISENLNNDWRPIIQNSSQRSYLVQGPPNKAYTFNTEIYTRWEAPPLTNLATQAQNYRVEIPVNVQPPYKVMVMLHSHLSNLLEMASPYYFDGIILAANDFVPISSPMSTWWSGWNENYNFTDTSKCFRGECSNMGKYYTRDRVVSFLEWSKTNWQINDQKIGCSGASMGGTGARRFCLQNPQIFSYVVGKVEGNPQNDFEHLFGKPSDGVINDNGIPIWDELNITYWLRENLTRETPFITFSYGKPDNIFNWGNSIEFYRAMRDTRRPFIFRWGTQGHSQSVLSVGLNTTNNVSIETMEFLKNKALPAFYNFSLDNNPGNGDINDGDIEGFINGYQRWDPNTIIDQPTHFEMEMWLINKSSNITGTMDITLRKLQSFAVVSGQSFNWKLMEDALIVKQGTGVVDEWGLVNIENIVLTNSTKRNLVIDTLSVSNPLCGNNIVESGEACDDGNTDNGDGCSSICTVEVPACTLSNAYWLTTNAVQGQSVSLRVEGNNCNGKTLDFNVYEADDADPDENANINPTSVTFVNNLATGTWNAEWQCDGDFGGVCTYGDPEYYFTATVRNEGTSISSEGRASGSLDITELSATCGNGILQGTEQCDDGNTINSDACTNSCTSAICGDNIVRSGFEICDGNTRICTINGYAGTQACNNQCNAFNTCIATESCGDGRINGNEICDDGANNGNANKCNLQCTEITASLCGNSITEAGEQCDDGNTIQTDSCLNTCVSTTCGDGIVQSPNGNNVNEICDDGVDNGNANKCNSQCTGLTSALCGNNIIETGEACDDGNTVNTDDCTNSCITAVCGDGITRIGIEECDAGTIGNSQCTSLCKLTTCGDGIIQSPNGIGVNEICDGGSMACSENGYNGVAGCNGLCTAFASCVLTESCGDGIIQSTAGETCDDSNNIDGDGCNALCKLEVLGCDDIDGDGYGVGETLSCDSLEIDCNDNNINIHPNAIEICNGIDDNCALGISDEITNTYYLDGDNDQYGNASSTIKACTAPLGYVLNGLDCNDDDVLVYQAIACTYNSLSCGAYQLCAQECPVPPAEICGNNVDENCNGAIEQCSIASPVLLYLNPKNVTYKNQLIPLNFTAIGASNCWYVYDGVQF
ncbi:MAG: DUF4215 domain-containing protein, partial [Nanoarchaeota archaeon]|nr:DUF4215 domain-containing protein [Nanoarchaeota archaeon]